MPTVSRRYGGGGQRFERPSSIANDALKAPVVLMVSGGADSTALLLLAASAPLDICDGRGLSRVARERLHVLHVNHGLRGLDAQEDEEFVRELSQRFGIPCTVVSANVAELAAGGGGDSNVENVGREVRYREASRLADRLCGEVGCDRSAARILTAHTADDRAETFVMNAIRGTGPAGLASIPRKRGRVVRPLLDYTHDELCDYLRMHGCVWREDKTNADTRYLRAYVRHEVMPTLTHKNARVAKNLATTCDILSDEDAYMNSVATRAYRDLVRRRSGSMVALDANRLAACEVAIARRVVRKALLDVCPDARLEARHITRVLRLVAAGSGSASVPMGCDVRIEYGLMFVRVSAQEQEGIASWLEVPPSGVGRLALPGGRELAARMTEVPMGSSAPDVARAHALEWNGASVLLDAPSCGLDGASGGRLWVDSAQPGDVMCPFGMHGQSKKLSDILNEARIPAAERAGVPVVRTSPQGPVIWLAPIRSDERQRCLPGTRLLLELSLVSHQA